jgi:hypothetical protein
MLNHAKKEFSQMTGSFIRTYIPQQIPLSPGLSQAPLIETPNKIDQRIYGSGGLSNMQQIPRTFTQLELEQQRQVITNYKHQRAIPNPNNPYGCYQRFIQ